MTQRYLQVRHQTTFLCEPLAAEDFVVQPITDVSPPKWHLAHTTWFFENFVLDGNLPGYKRFHPQYGFLFNSYYHHVGERWQRPLRGNLTRPTTDEILAYRQFVDQHMEQLLNQTDLVSEALQEVVVLGLQHEQQHQELLVTDLKYILGHNPLFPEYRPALPQSGPTLVHAEHYLPVEEGIFEVGFAGQGFHFDNETSRHRVFLEPYQILDRLVTNREYLDFVEDGGYQQFAHWLAEGWDWVQKEGHKSPLYWHKIDGIWMNYTLSGLRPLDLDEPVTHINYYEADAFAAWMGKRLPTEFEWEVAASQFGGSNLEAGNLCSSGFYHPRKRQGDDHQFYGDGWEWTQSAYLPYPRYKRAPGALGEYNGKFMVGQMVLRGGSCATPDQHIRTTYRNFFHPHLSWQFTALRLAESL